MRVAYCCIGSRGDTQPHIAFCVELARAGHTVRLWQAPDYVDLVPPGVPGLQIFTSSSTCASVMERLAPIFAKGDSGGAVHAIFDEQARSFASDADSILAMCENWADVVVASTLTTNMCLAVAEVLQIKLVRTHVQPILPTSEFHVILPFTPPKWINLFIWMLLFKTATPPKLMNAITDWKRRHGCHTPVLNPWKATYYYDFPTINGFSPSSFPVPADWDCFDQVTTGDWILSSDDLPEKPSPSLSKFLAESKTPPVYIGWGSMVYASGEHMTELAVRALYKAGLRGILFRGSSHNSKFDLSLDKLDASKHDAKELLAWAQANVLVLNGVSHEWLFPQVSAICHHGGAGTSAAAMRSGSPSIVTPFTLDQFGYARISKDSGLGPGLLPQFSKLTADVLAAALTEAVMDPSYKAGAQKVRERMLDERGTRAAVKALEHFYKTRDLWKERALREETGTALAVEPPSFICCCASQKARRMSNKVIQ
mmetsp:Transcript_8701/g.18045  ORF Transcript_8701/g.18045 Transcript_8701/m.18045 type:complete len:483 (+) Transcript_8701:45-1493(+)